LNAHLRDMGLFFPIDPGANASIGGMASTRASGTNAVRYGTMRENVLSLTVVLPSGQIIRTGGRARKSSAGYDLTRLFVGSEGTLGIVTEVTVRLRPTPAPARTVAGFFGSAVDAGSAVQAVRAAGVPVAALELVDRTCLEAVDAWKNMGLSVEADTVLLARIDEPDADGDRLAAEVVACFRQAGASWADRSTDPDEAEALFAARRLAYPALERLCPVLTEDVCVPVGAVAEMLSRIGTVADTHGVKIANVAHAGDGNLHPLILTPAGDPSARARAQAAFEDILDHALALGGTVTGEHGVGLLKLHGLGRELPDPVRRMQRAVRHALDPHGILNPGKAY